MQSIESKLELKQVLKTMKTVKNGDDNNLVQPEISQVNLPQVINFFKEP